MGILLVRIAIEPGYMINTRLEYLFSLMLNL